MSITDPQVRRRAAVLARSACALSALAFGLGLVGTLTTDVRPAAAAVQSGVATLLAISDVGEVGAALTSGDGGTNFTFDLPDGPGGVTEPPSCTGDSAGGGYYVHSYMVASNIDPALAEFGNDGPEPRNLASHAAFRGPLFDIFGSQYSSAATSLAESAGGPGRIDILPAFDFSTLLDPAAPLLHDGAYNIGIACWHLPTDPTEDPSLDKFWNVVIDVDITGPGLTGAAWAVQPPPTATSVDFAVDPVDEAPEGEDVTLTATVSPAAATGTITFLDEDTALQPPVTVAAGTAELVLDDLDRGDYELRATFTPAAGSSFGPSSSDELEYTILPPAAGSTTSTTRSGSTTSTTRSGSSTTSTTSGSGSSTTSTTSASGARPTSTTAASGGNPRTGNNAGNLAQTGFSFSLAVWGLLALVFGRMALLLGRPLKIRKA